MAKVSAGLVQSIDARLEYRPSGDSAVPAASSNGGVTGACVPVCVTGRYRQLREAVGGERDVSDDCARFELFL
jgi:hypothetical protein